jgi:4-carboxymuconolactone decarboxylase
MTSISQTSTSQRPPLNIRGHRFAPLTWETMSPEQVAMADSVMAGKRGSMQGPYNVLMRSPALGNLAQQFGEHTRFNSSLPLAMNELVILLVARTWTSQFVWWAHKRIALDAGLDADLVDAIATGHVPEGLAQSSEVAAVYRFCHELLQKKQVSDATYAALVTHYGERGVVDVMGTISYYTLVSMSLNVDQYPLPEGAQPELKTL